MPARQRYLVPPLVAAPTAVGIAAAASAAADCSQDESPVSTRTPLPATTPYVPYPCDDVDWIRDQGLGIAVGD